MRREQLRFLVSLALCLPPALGIVACSSNHTGGGGQVATGSLAVASVVPPTGTTAGLSQVTITGSGFVPGQTSVTIGGQPATITGASSTMLTVITPPGIPGSTAVVVTVGAAMAQGGFAYVGSATTVGPGPATLTITPSATPVPAATVAAGSARVPVLRFAASASGGDVIVDGLTVTSQSIGDPSAFVSLVELMDANQNVVASSTYHPGVVQPPGIGAPNLLPQAPLSFQYPLASGASMEFTVLFTFALTAPSGTTIAANPPSVNAADAHNSNLWVTIVNNVLAGGPVITIR